MAAVPDRPIGVNHWLAKNVIVATVTNVGTVKGFAEKLGVTWARKAYKKQGKEWEWNTRDTVETLSPRDDMKDHVYPVVPALVLKDNFEWNEKAITNDIRHQVASILARAERPANK
jgi:hypothetical protein